MKIGARSLRDVDAGEQNVKSQQEKSGGNGAERSQNYLKGPTHQTPACLCCSVEVLCLAPFSCGVVMLSSHC